MHLLYTRRSHGSATSRRISILALLVLTTSVTHGWATDLERTSSPEGALYEAVRPSVFTVSGERGHGTGFLITTDGLIATNEHVVAGSRSVSVWVDGETHVSAQVLVEDEFIDLAILQLPVDAIAGLKPLLLRERSGADRPAAGDRVIAVGCPRRLDRVLTSGTIGSVRDDLIVADISADHGSSGGPVLDLGGRVVGITTFTPASGLVGVVPSWRLLATVEKVGAVDEMEMDSLPTFPETPFPLRALPILSEEDAPRTDYLIDPPKNKGGFSAWVNTPLSRYRSNHASARRLDEARRNKSVDRLPTADWEPKYWETTVGSQYAPVVEIVIVPRIAQTTSSLIANLVGSSVAAMMDQPWQWHEALEFEGDIGEVVLSDGSSAIRPIMTQYFPMRADFFTSRSSASDLVDGVILWFRPDDFPAPQVYRELQIRNLRSGQWETMAMPHKTVERIWLDFDVHRFAAAGRRQMCVVDGK